MDYEDMALADICKLPGLADLTLRVRGKFGQALKRESEGYHQMAEELLNMAVAYEQEG